MRRGKTRPRLKAYNNGKEKIEKDVPRRVAGS